ncbi:unnamed protein product, partial [Choristocarpus tenellus]
MRLLKLEGYLEMEEESPLTLGSDIDIRYVVGNSRSSMSFMNTQKTPCSACLENCQCEMYEMYATRERARNEGNKCKFDRTAFVLMPTFDPQQGSVYRRGLERVVLR